MLRISSLIISFFVNFIDSFDGKGLGYTEIPHPFILNTETIIEMDSNLLTILSDHEFSLYPLLDKVSLCHNRIHTISATAFEGTVVSDLCISHNALTQFPDLWSINNTLAKLQLSDNLFHSVPKYYMDALPKVYRFLFNDCPIQEWPDFTNVGRDVCHNTYCYLFIDGMPHIVNGTTFCHFFGVWLTNYPLTEIYNITCPSGSRLNMVSYTNAELDETVSTEPVLGLVQLSKISQFGLQRNKYTTFVDLPMAIRPKLISLYLQDNLIQYISEDHLQGYDLYQLDLSRNKLMGIPPFLYQYTKILTLSGNTLTDWNGIQMNLDLCNSTKIEILDLASTTESLALVPILKPAFCSKSLDFTLDFSSIHEPCDCSIQWIASAITECPATLAISNIPCGAADWASVNTILNCPPEPFLLLYYEDLITGTPLLIDSNGFDLIGHPANNKAHTIVVRGSSWHLYDSIDLSLNNPNWIFSSGSYTAGNDFDANSISAVREVSEVYHGNTVPISLSQMTCNDVTDPNKLIFDGDDATCVPVQIHPQVLSYPAEVATPVNIFITTKDMDCALKFHVTPYGTNQDLCPPKFGCFLQSSSNIAEKNLYRCVFNCQCSVLPKCGDTWEIRISTTNQGKLCGVNVERFFNPFVIG